MNLHDLPRTEEGNIYLSDVYSYFNITTSGWDLDFPLRRRLYNFLNRVPRETKFYL